MLRVLNVALLLGLGASLAISVPRLRPHSPVPPPGSIQVVAATYGGNCGQPRGNVSGYLAAACDGLRHCGYKVDYRVIGDPAYGCSKTYVAEWTCPGSPQILRVQALAEAGYGSIVQLGCPGSAYIPPSAPPPGGPIHVISGSYGQNCQAPDGNKTEHLFESCEGRTTCAYRIDYRVIGNPAVGCGKSYVAEWRCGDDLAVYRAFAPPEAGYGGLVTLACDGSVEPAR